MIKNFISKNSKIQLFNQCNKAFTLLLLLSLLLVPKPRRGLLESEHRIGSRTKRHVVEAAVIDIDLSSATELLIQTK